MLKLRLVALTHHRVVTQEAYRLEQEVVKIERTSIGQQLLIQLIDLCHRLLEGKPRTGCIVAGREELILSFANCCTGSTRLELVCTNGKLLHRLFDEPLTVVFVINHEIWWNADSRTITPQDPHTNTMECPHPRHKGARWLVGLGHVRRACLGVPGNLPEALAHLAGCFVGEGDGQDFIGPDTLLCQKVGNAVRERFCLTTARPCENQDRAIKCHYCRTLGVI